MILLIDNYDSFTYNLFQYIGEMVPDIQVVRNDEITIDEIEALAPQALILSPGPGYPKDAGITLEAVRRFSGQMPILGVCLGHQSICEAFGGTIERAQVLMHGKSSQIRLDRTSEIFANLPEKIECGRYHSLIVRESDFPEALRVTATDGDGQIMAVQHRAHPTYGVQFHPESLLTPEGKRILANFLNLVDGIHVKSPTASEKLPKTELCKYMAKVVDGVDLTQEEAEKAVDIIMSGEATNAQTAAFLTSLRIKGETIGEITGFAKGMRAKAIRVENAEESLEIVGTGGDLAKSFNISTTSTFVVSAAGMPVAKHGNRSVSSKSGAADVLESLGAKIQTTHEMAERSIKEVGLAFLFAQSYHGAMRFVAPVRRELGIRTVFNILGPLTNPAFNRYILLGVYDNDLLPVMARVLIGLGIKHAMVVHGNDGLDEVSISDTTSVAEVRDGKIIEYTIAPEDFGLTRAVKDDIVGGTPDENAQITRDILSGKIQGAKRDVVLLNAGCALYTAGKAQSIAEGIDIAREQIDSGRAFAKMEEFIAFSNQEAEA